MANYPTDGTAKDVTDWVGDNQERAAEAAAAENERDKPRRAVLNHLERLAGVTGETTFTNEAGDRRVVSNRRASTVAHYDNSPHWTRS